MVTLVGPSDAEKFFGSVTDTTASGRAETALRAASAWAGVYLASLACCRVLRSPSATACSPVFCTAVAMCVLEDESPRITLAMIPRMSGPGTDRCPTTMLNGGRGSNGRLIGMVRVG